MTTPEKIMPRPSFTLALALLAQEVRELEELEERVREKRGERNVLLQDARDNGVPYKKLMQVTGLSRDTIAGIVNSPAIPTGQKAY